MSRLIEIGQRTKHSSSGEAASQRSQRSNWQVLQRYKSIEKTPNSNYMEMPRYIIDTLPRYVAFTESWSCSIDSLSPPRRLLKSHLPLLLYRAPQHSHHALYRLHCTLHYTIALAFLLRAVLEALFARNATARCSACARPCALSIALCSLKKTLCQLWI